MIDLSNKEKSMKDRILVGDLINELAKYPNEMPITFGASKYRKRPLVFHRTKIRGEKLICIELGEFDRGSVATVEWSWRITVGDLIRDLEGCGDDWKVDFGCSADGCPLVFNKLHQVLAIDLDQPEEPKYKFSDD